MRRLKVQVECAVRPVRASIRRKMRMREELLAHLTTGVESGLAEGLNEDEAVRRALERFGDPAAVGAELQSSVPALERLLYVRLPIPDKNRAQQFAERRSGESALRHAFRYCLLFFWLPIFGMDLLIVALKLAFPGHGRPLNEMPALFVGLEGIPFTFAFFYLIVLDVTENMLQRAQSLRRIVAPIAGFCILLCGLVIISGIAIRSVVRQYMDCSSALLFWEFVAACALIPASLIAFAAVNVAQRKRREEWEALVLDE